MTLCDRDDINKKPPSRWDTPSPDVDLMNLKKGSQGQSPSMSRHGTESVEVGANDSDDDGWVGWGRGRGKKRKRNRKKGKNK